MTPTIAAIATGPAAGGIGIIRLSGPSALAAARCVATSLPAKPTPRRAHFTRFHDGEGRVLDEGLVLWFAAPHSFTGEEVVELHAHGAPRLLSLLLNELLRHPDVRLATPGEFTRRAFLAGRLDLTRAEAVADLVAAESEAQVRAAAAQLSGELTRRLEQLHAPLLALQADLEGVLDFPEEAEAADHDAAARLDATMTLARGLLEDARRGALVRRGARVVLFGPVNAGKSTLFNALVGASRALVDPEPGTTRDTLEARVELAGLAVTLVDTAGLREGAGRLEALGIARTRDAVRGADLSVLVLPPDATADQRAQWLAEAPAALVVRGKSDLDAAGHGALAVSGLAEAHAALVVRGKSDLDAGGKDALAVSGLAEAPALVVRGKSDLDAGGKEVLAVSGLTGAGLDALRTVLARRLASDAGAAVSTVSERHVRALTDLEEALARARIACDVATTEIVAGEVSLALRALAELTGADTSTELLDAIFARFCIGK